MLLHFSLGILILVLGVQIFLHFFTNGRLSNTSRILVKGLNRHKLFKYVFIGAVVLIFVSLFFQTFKQFQTWSRDEISKFLLPPHQPVSYFTFYVVTRFFASYLTSFLISLVFLFSAKKINKKHQERFFYPEEPYFGALSIFLLGHPAWLIYLVILIFVYLVLHLSLVIGQLSIVKGNRISLYYLWLPTAIFVIIIQRWLEQLSLWSLLKL